MSITNGIKLQIYNIGRLTELISRINLEYYEKYYINKSSQALLAKEYMCKFFKLEKERQTRA